MNTGKNTCQVAIHFTNTPHSLTDSEFTVTEKVINAQEKEETLLIREAYWAAQLGTLQPTGLNKRCEYRTKTHINYNYKQGIPFNVNQYVNFKKTFYRAF